MYRMKKVLLSRNGVFHSILYYLVQMLQLFVMSISSDLGNALYWVGQDRCHEKDHRMATVRHLLLGMWMGGHAVHTANESYRNFRHRLRNHCRRI